MQFIYTFDLELLKETVLKQFFSASETVDTKAANYRINQIKDWAYFKRISDWNQAKNLPKDMRLWLNETFNLRSVENVLSKRSSDKTEKFLMKLKDETFIESVVISDKDRLTLCVSSQLGCAYGCKFCASGSKGFKRNLTTAEIISQILCVEDKLIERQNLTTKENNLIFDNIVFMGMGEPLANMESVFETVDILTKRFEFGARRITISTVGLVDKILILAKNNTQFRLAVSLHGTTNEIRSQIMPVTQKYPLEILLQAIEEFGRLHHGMVTLEYILIDNLNSDTTQAAELAKIAKRLHAHVNLIPYNPVPGLKFERPSVEKQRAFSHVLQMADVSFTLRMEKGVSIDAACGQLALNENELSKVSD